MRSSWRPARRTGWAASTSSARPSPVARCSPGRSTRSPRPGRRADRGRDRARPGAACRGAAWLPAKVVAVVAGGERRQDSVAGRVRRARALGAGPGDGARVVLVHDGARPLVAPALIEDVADRGRRARRRHPGRCPSSRPSSGSTAAASRRRSTGPTLAAAQTPAGRSTRHPARGASRGPGRPATTRGPTRPRCWRPVAFAVHVVHGDPAISR